MKPIEVELKRLEDLSEAIVQDFDRMRQNEKHMRDTNGNLFEFKLSAYLLLTFILFTEQTNARVFYFSIFSLFCLMGLATWQSLYLRRFFKSKKLIE